jgi:hypothetical protein
VRKYTILGLLLPAMILVYCGESSAYLFEAHPGVHLAYEYTDNYFGTAKDKRDESIYEVGPKLDLKWAIPAITATMSGYVTRTGHYRFNQDDSTEANIAAAASFLGIRQSLDLSYAYLQTERRATLAEPRGLSKTNSGSASYMKMLSPLFTVNLGYEYSSVHYSSLTGDDEVTQIGRTRITYQLTRRNSVDLFYEYEDYRYQIAPNANGMSTGVDWHYAATPRLLVGLHTNYKIQDRGKDLPKEDIYDLMPTATYNLSQHTSFTASAGKSWLVLEHSDRQSIYSMNATLNYTALQDMVALSVSKAYEAQFTSNLYGIYNTKSATLLLQKGIMRTLVGIIDFSLIRTIPISNANELIPVLVTHREDETDTVGRASLVWDPNKYLTVKGIYEYLQHDFEIADTERENRYRMVLEVRY